MKRSLVIFALSAVTTSCVGVVVNTAGSARDATEAALMQADRDFAVASPMPEPESAAGGVYCDGCHEIKPKYEMPKVQVNPAAKRNKTEVAVHLK